MSLSRGIIAGQIHYVNESGRQWSRYRVRCLCRIIDTVCEAQVPKLAGLAGSKNTGTLLANAPHHTDGPSSRGPIFLLTRVTRAKALAMIRVVVSYMQWLPTDRVSGFGCNSPLSGHPSRLTRH